MTEDELKAELEAAELKKDDEARAILDDAIQKIVSMNRMVVPSVTLIGRQIKWQLNIVRK